MNGKLINKKLCIGLCVLQTAAVLSLGGCGKKPVEQLQEIKNVRTLQVQKGAIGIEVQYSSKLKPVEEVYVSSKVGGRVESVKADVGQEVKGGEILFTLDRKDAEAQHQQSQASLEAANANFRRTSDSALSQQITQAQSAQEQAQIQFDNVREVWNKTQKLYQSGAVSKQVLEDTEARYKSAQNQLETAKESLKLLKEKSGPQTVEVASADVGRAKAGVNQSAALLDNMTVVSPISGTVAVRNIDAGEMASSGSPAFTIINTQALTAELGIPDKMVQKVKKGQTVGVIVPAAGEQVFDGKVESISPSADPKTQLYTVKIRVDNTAGQLKPGMFARAALPADKKENVLTVPNEAIVMESGMQYVFTATGGVIRKKAVTTGLSNEKATEIVKGLEEGDNIITEGQNFLNEGEAVNVVK